MGSPPGCADDGDPSKRGEIRLGGLARGSLSVGQILVIDEGGWLPEFFEFVGADVGTCSRFAVRRDGVAVVLEKVKETEDAAWFAQKIQITSAKYFYDLVQICH